MFFFNTFLYWLLVIKYIHKLIYNKYAKYYFISTYIYFKIIILNFFILDSEWSDECIDFTMMCFFF